MTDTTYITPEFVQGIIDEPGILGPAIVELATKYLALLGEFEVVSKSEWKLAGDLTELQMNYNALKAKLANPVVLRDCSFEAVSHMAHWYSEGECVAWVSGAENVKKQIVAAGFSVREEK